MSVNPRPQILLYPRIRKSPFFYASRQHGVAMYSVYNRTYHPRHYGDPVAEYWSLLNGVTLWDVGVERQIEITGPDAFDFTNLLVTRDLTRCQVGQCKYVFLTDDDGGILNDPVLLRLGENHFWLSLADSDILLWARGVAYRSGYDVQIREADVGPLQVQGPKSAAVMRDIFGPAVLDIPYYYLREFDVDGIQVVVSRTGYTAEVGYEIYVRNAGRDALRMWDIIWQPVAAATGWRSSDRATSAGSRAGSSPTGATSPSTPTRSRWGWATTGWSASTRTPTSSASRP